jgi:hypothetical protein
MRGMLLCSVRQYGGILALRAMTCGATQLLIVWHLTIDEIGTSSVVTKPPRGG